jgi:regulator of protease activity HflC (stomatin/prohibitin superfamily)
MAPGRRLALDAELRAYVVARLGETGIEVMELGMKDVILPGEIRDLVNARCGLKVGRGFQRWSARLVAERQIGNSLYGPFVL